MIINAAEIGLEIDNAVALGLEAAAIQAKSFLEVRVFAENKTTSGMPFGTYNSESYKAYRKSLGKQVVKKDLQLTGDLKNSIKQNENMVLFGDDESAEKAQEQERQLGIIFDLNEDEITDCIIVCDKIFTKDLLIALDKIKIVV